MSEIKPNHICKNPECRKKYYACDYCDRSKNWRSVACSFKCYEKYQEIVINARSKGKQISELPNRVDLSEQEVISLLNKPEEIVIEQTKQELSEYADIDGNIDFAKTVDEINYELNKKESNYSKRNSPRKSKNV